MHVHMHTGRLRKRMGEGLRNSVVFQKFMSQDFVMKRISSVLQGQGQKGCEFEATLSYL